MFTDDRNVSRREVQWARNEIETPYPHRPQQLISFSILLKSIVLRNKF